MIPGAPTSLHTLASYSSSSFPRIFALQPGKFSDWSSLSLFSSVCIPALIFHPQFTCHLHGEGTQVPGKTRFPMAHPPCHVPLIACKGVLTSDGDTWAPIAVIPLVPKPALAPSQRLLICSYTNNFSTSAPGSCWGAGLNLEGTSTAFLNLAHHSHSLSCSPLCLFGVYSVPVTAPPGTARNSCLVLGELL